MGECCTTKKEKLYNKEKRATNGPEQPSGKSDSWTLSEKSEKVFCTKMFESTRAIGARKNGN